MAYIDAETGEVCLRIAYVGDPKEGFRPCAAIVRRQYPSAVTETPERIAEGTYSATHRPPGLTCRGRPVRVELVGMSFEPHRPDTAARLMLRNVSGIIHLARGVTHGLKQLVRYQDVVNRALAFWQYDLDWLPQITQINGRYCSKCSQGFVEDDLIVPLLNPWGAPKMWSTPLLGTGVVEAFDTCLRLALARAEERLGPVYAAEPRRVIVDAMARRAFIVADAAGRSGLFPPEDRAWLRAQALFPGNHPYARLTVPHLTLLESA